MIPQKEKRLEDTHRDKEVDFQESKKKSETNWGHEEFHIGAKVFCKGAGKGGWAKGAGTVLDSGKNPMVEGAESELSLLESLGKRNERGSRPLTQSCNCLQLDMKAPRLCA